MYIYIYYIYVQALKSTYRYMVFICILMYYSIMLSHMCIIKSYYILSYLIIIFDYRNLIARVILSLLLLRD